MAVRMFKSLVKDADGNCTNEVAEWNVTYEGRVLYEYEKNGYDDSDFYAVCWDEEKGELVHTMYATTRGWTYPNSATPDFTPESDPEAWAAMMEVLKPRARAELLSAAKARKEKESRFFERGMKVEVVKGKAKGAAGTLFWVGSSRKYGYYSKPTTRCGLSPSGVKGEDGKYADAVWTYLENCVNPDFNMELTEEDLAGVEALVEGRANYYVEAKWCG